MRNLWEKVFQDDHEENPEITTSQAFSRALPPLRITEGPQRTEDLFELLHKIITLQGNLEGEEIFGKPRLA